MQSFLSAGLLKVYKKLPYLNRLSAESVENGLLRIKYMLPFLLDKKHPVEGVFRKIFFQSFAVSALLLSVYFWYVTGVSGKGVVFFQATFFLWVSGWSIATYYGRKLHEMHLRYKERGKHSIEFPYIYKSRVAGIFALFLLVVVGIKSDIIVVQTTNLNMLLYQYIFLVVIFNYIVNILMIYMDSIYIEDGIFEPKGINVIWVLSLLFFLYQLY